MPQENIRILITGGTFDKEYNELTGELFFKNSHLPEMLAKGRCACDVEFRTLMMVDSLEMSDADREIIANQCRRSPTSRIVITHGTDTMVETAGKLAHIPHKTMVLTGAMQPARFKTSDAAFNIGGAIAAVQVLAPGAYIVMNGCVFQAGNVRKNVEENRFEWFTEASDE